ncbi:uncharacterized protein FFE2_08655 [Fusarium fujikuroi]|nr:uncharacterized protein FFE2_08655 [Fusarium fujikuroi]
MFIGALRTRP